MAGALLPLVAMGQELVVRSAHAQTAAATQPVEARLPPMDYSHPMLAGDAGWAGLMVGLVLVSFILAALIGVITDIDKSYTAPESPRDGRGSPAARH